MKNLLLKNPFVLFQGYNVYRKIPDIVNLILSIDNKTTFNIGCKGEEKEIFENYYTHILNKNKTNFMVIEEKNIIKLMLKKNSKLPSVIIINNLEENSVNNYIIMNLWLHIFENRDHAPLLLLFSNSDSIIDTPFKFNKDNTYCDKNRKCKNIIYHEKNIFHKNYDDIIKNLSQTITYYHAKFKMVLRGEKKSTWLVFLSSKKG